MRVDEPTFQNLKWLLTARHGSAALHTDRPGDMAGNRDELISVSTDDQPRSFGGLCLYTVHRGGERQHVIFVHNADLIHPDLRAVIEGVPRDQQRDGSDPWRWVGGTPHARVPA